MVAQIAYTLFRSRAPIKHKNPETKSINIHAYLHKYITTPFHATLIILLVISPRNFIILLHLRLLVAMSIIKQKCFHQFNTTA